MLTDQPNTSLPTSQLLSSERLTLRALEPSDLDFLFRLENDPAHWLVSNTLAPYSKAVLQQYLANAHYDIYTTRQLRLVICTKAGEQAGAIDLYDFDPQHLRAGVGIMVLPEFRRQQLATESLHLLENYCRVALLLHQLHCMIEVGNAASMALFSRNGFTRVGVRKEWLRTADGWLDVVELQKIF